MRADHGKIDENPRVADGLDLYGMVTGTVSVAPGGRLEFRGDERFARDEVTGVG